MIIKLKLTKETKQYYKYTANTGSVICSGLYISRDLFPEKKEEIEIEIKGL